MLRAASTSEWGVEHGHPLKYNPPSKKFKIALRAAGTPGPFLGVFPKKGPGVPARFPAILGFLDGGDLFFRGFFRGYPQFGAFSSVFCDLERKPLFSLCPSQNRQGRAGQALPPSPTLTSLARLACDPPRTDLG